MYSKQFFITSYKRWLEMMNYDPSSVRNGPVRLGVFLDWMEANGAHNIEQMTGQKVKAFFAWLGEKKSERTGKVLSLATQRTYLTTLKRFARYLRHAGQGNLEAPVTLRGKDTKPVAIFSEAEIRRLYQACADDLLGMRDRAMLAVFYGCGLRRNEAVKLQAGDVLGGRDLLYVRHGKGYRERYVPMSGKVRLNILEYLEIARPSLLGGRSETAFFIGGTGRRLGGSNLYERLGKLKKKAGITKAGGLHSLRHSIATHLLRNGMPLPAIARFLGHSSLESTQIYTHLSADKDGLPL